MVVRIVIIALLSAAFAFHIILHLFDDDGLPTSVQWQQPELQDNEFYGPINEDQWHFNFTPIDALIQLVPIENGNQLIVNSATRELLVRFFALLPENLSVDEQHRVQFLVTKSVIAPANEQLVELINSYRQYNEKIADLEGQTALDLQEKQNILVQHQASIFGADTANKLFGDKNLTTQYLLDRQRINQQTRLSPEEKSTALAKLKLAYQQAKAEYDR